MKNFFVTTAALVLSLSAFAEKKTDFTEPTSQTQSSVTYVFPEIRTQPGDAIRFYIPQHLRSQVLSYVILGHHQDPATHKGGTPGQKQDAIPGLSAILVHSTNLHDANSQDAWRYWGGMSSGKYGAKFAEPRTDLEMENLYEWNSIGSSGIATNDFSQEGLLIDNAVVQNVGEDEVLVGSITLKFIPNGINHVQDVIFSQGTVFSADFGGKPKLGGGQAYQYKGTFPNALVLNNQTHTIDLEPGKEFKGVEVALGDSRPDQQQNSDGGWGKQGWGKFSMGIGTTEADIQWLTQRENVPPEGLALAYPVEKTIAKKGMKLFIRGTEDTVYVMGVRVSYGK